MIKLENFEVMGWEHVIRGMRNPMNSWDKSDSVFMADDGDTYDILGNFSLWPGESYADTVVGPNDFDLMMRLAKAGPVDGKFRRMIVVYVDIIAPLYWWKEFDTYKVGTVANSCSTMHKIHAKEFTMDDFSHEHLMKMENQEVPYGSEELFDYDYPDVLRVTIDALNSARTHFLETKEKQWWWQMIQLLPSSYNQRRTIMLNYEVLSNIYMHRRNHKLDEWREFCCWIEGLPYHEIITCNAA